MRLGVPLEFSSCAAEELPHREYVGSVRALILGENEVKLEWKGVSGATKEIGAPENRISWFRRTLS